VHETVSLTVLYDELLLTCLLFIVLCAICM